MGKFSQYKVQLASLPDGVTEQDFVCDTQFFKNMECADVISGNVNVHLVVVKKNDAYDCSFTLKGDLEIPCDRCLDPMPHEVDTTYHITVKYGPTYSDDSDDVLEIPYEDTYLNVAYMLYDTIVLTIPMRHVHPMGQCNRAMAAALSKHRTGDPEADEALDEVEEDAAEDQE